MAEHTPGPWRYGTMRYQHDSFGYVYRGLRGKIMIEFNDNGEADAALIAAAPDMFAVLAKILSECALYELKEEAEAALAKAQGLTKSGGE